MNGKLSSLPLHNNIVLNFNTNGKELKEIFKEYILLYKGILQIYSAPKRSIRMDILWKSTALIYHYFCHCH